jgi:hypothetical protein
VQKVRDKKVRMGRKRKRGGGHFFSMRLLWAKFGSNQFSHRGDVWGDSMAHVMFSLRRKSVNRFIDMEYSGKMIE